jgi:hypothetical protein
MSALRSLTGVKRKRYAQCEFFISRVDKNISTDCYSFARGGPRASATSTHRPLPQPETKARQRSRQQRRRRVELGSNAARCPCSFPILRSGAGPQQLTCYSITHRCGWREFFPPSSLHLLASGGAGTARTRPGWAFFGPRRRSQQPLAGTNRPDRNCLVTEERRTIVILSPAHQGGAFLFA